MVKFTERVSLLAWLDSAWDWKWQRRVQTSEGCHGFSRSNSHSVLRAAVFEYFCISSPAAASKQTCDKSLRFRCNCRALKFNLSCRIGVFLSLTLSLFYILSKVFCGFTVQDRHFHAGEVIQYKEEGFWSLRWYFFLFLMLLNLSKLNFWSLSPIWSVYSKENEGNKSEKM